MYTVQNIEIIAREKKDRELLQILLLQIGLFIQIKRYVWKGMKTLSNLYYNKLFSCAF